MNEEIRVTHEDKSTFMFSKFKILVNRKKIGYGVHRVPVIKM